MAIPPGAGQARAARLLGVSRDAFWELRPRTGEAWHSPQVPAWLGRPDEPGAQAPCTWRDVEATLHPDDLPGLRQAVRRALEGESGFTVALRGRTADGGWRRLQARVHRQLDEHGELLLFGTLQDLETAPSAGEAGDALVRALARAEQARQAAEAANTAKTQFLAQMSHEIRTPLTGVLGMIELALRTPLSPPVQRYLATANESAQALLHVISDLLDLSRIESGQVELAEEPFDPARLMAHALRATLPLSSGQELALLFDWEGESPRLLGDPGALRQVVTNLLVNAVKFTPRGQVALQGRCGALPGQPGRAGLCLRISDTGPGIDPARRARIFEPFVQGGPAPVRGGTGAGLGLAIARRLVQAMGGELTLDCPAAGGTVVTLSLALPAVADPHPRPPALPVAAGAVAWLVDATPPGGPWMARRLHRLGWHGVLFTSVDAALLAAHGGTAPRPGLVLVDQSALATTASLGPLRQALAEVPLRLVVPPSWDQPALEAEAHALGLQILVAPLTPQQLGRLHGEDGVLPDEAEDRRLAPAPSPPRPPEVLLVEDNALNLLVGREYLQAMGLAVREAATGAGAVAACLAEPPALVLLDLELPDMDGFEVSRRLRALQRQGAWPGAPIVALTAHAGTADRRACRAAGMDGMLTKPMSLAKLRRRLARWLAV